MRHLFLFVTTSLFFLSIASNQAGALTDEYELALIQPMDTLTKKVIDHHFASFRQNNLEEILADYTDESIIFTPDANYTGLHQIKAFFIKALSNFPQEGTTIIIDKLSTEGNMGYVVWHGETPGFIITFSTATYIIEKGKILRHTIGRVAVPKN